MKQDAQLALSVQLPDDETFESFVGNTNQESAELLEQFIVNKIDDKSVSSFYLFGLSGVGKSHLLHAVSNLADSLNLSSLCLSVSELIQLPVNMLDGLENIDVVCIDDVHLLVGNMTWQQAIFDLFNRLKEQNKKVVISGDQAVSDLSLELPDLVSRLSWGLVAQVKPLTDDEKMTAIQYRAQQRGLVIQGETIKFLFNHYSRDMQVLVGYLDTLDKLSIREQRKITIPFIKQALSSD